MISNPTISKIIIIFVYEYSYSILCISFHPSTFISPYYWPEFREPPNLHHKMANRVHPLKLMYLRSSIFHCMPSDVTVLNNVY